MIAATGGGAGFGGAIDYTTGEDEEKGVFEFLQEELGIKEREVRVSEVQTRNVVMDDLDHIKDEMRITANQNTRVEKPRYSLSVSYHPDDDPSDEEMIEDMDTLLERRGLGEHQAVYAVHRDHDHAHIHATINRVHPETGDLWRDSYDYYENMSVLREIEQERGWTRPKRDDSRGRIADWKIRKFQRTGEIPFGQEVAAQAGDIFAEAETWEELQKRLAEKGLQIQRKGSGGIVTDGEEEAPLSEVARKWSFNRLDDRFPDQFQTYDRTQGPDRSEDGEAEAAGRRAGGDQKRDPGAESGHQRSERGDGSDQAGDEQGRGGEKGGTQARREAGDDAGDSKRGHQDREESRKDLRREAAGPVEDPEHSGRRGGDEGGDREDREGSDHEADSGDSRGNDYSDVDPLEYGDAEPLESDQDEIGEVGPVDGEGYITVPERLSEAGERVSRHLTRGEEIEAAREWAQMDEDQRAEDKPHFGKTDWRALQEGIRKLKKHIKKQEQSREQSQEKSQSKDKGRDRDQGRGRGGRGGRGR